MAQFKKPGRFDGPSRSRSYERSDAKELYRATCNKCRTECQVPFRPNGKKPVYCTNCFARPESTYPEKREFSERRPTHAPAQSDAALQDLTRRVESMERTLKDLIVTIDTFNRATALTNEIRKHFPEPEEKTKPKAAVKKAVKKTVTKTVKK